MAEQPQVIAFMVGAEIADDDPHKWIKLRALAISDAAEALEDAARSAEVWSRAAAVDAVAELAACPGFDLDDVCEAGEARVGEAGVDAALGVVAELQQVEMLRW